MRLFKIALVYYTYHTLKGSMDVNFVKSRRLSAYSLQKHVSKETY